MYAGANPAAGEFQHESMPPRGCATHRRCQYPLASRGCRANCPSTLPSMTLVERARDIADNVLFPAALAVDDADRVPPEHLDLLAAEGFYGAPADADLDFAGLAAIVEALASGDLATTLVWIQHLTPVMALLGETSPLADAWLPALVAGERRGGIALAGLRPPKNFLRVRRSGSDFVLDGTVPWVTGCGMLDVVYVAARDADDVVHFLLMDAPRGEVAPV